MEKKAHTHWWSNPSKATDIDEHRVVSAIELFCDLIFVAYIGSISHNLVHGITLHSVVEFIILFTIGWIIWFNSAMYHDLHGNNDFKTRVFTFLQMVCVGFMAIFSHDVIDHNYTYYMVPLAAIIFILGLLWRSTGIADPDHLVYSRPYSITFFILVIFLVASIFLPHDYRLYYLIGFLLLMSMPLANNYIFVGAEARKAFVERMRITHSFHERSDLYFIIVLGEIIIGSLNGFPAGHITLHSGLLLFCNFMIAFGLWFNHFEFVGHVEHKDGVAGVFTWLFSFFIEAITVAFIGGVVYLNYKHFSVNLLIIPTIAFFSAILLHFSFHQNIANPNIHVETKHAKIYMLISIVFLIAALFIDNLPLQIAFYSFALYFPVIIGLITWIRHSVAQVD